MGTNTKTKAKPKVTVKVPDPVVIPNYPQTLAYGERFGIEVPTRYNQAAHEAINTLMAADKLIVPQLFGFNARVVWICRGLAAMLFITRRESNYLTLRNCLQAEAGVGLLLILAALGSSLSKRWYTNLYLFVTGVSLVVNALMTEMEPGTGK